MINNIDTNIQKDIISNFIDRLIKLIILSYTKMSINKGSSVCGEDQRRNKLLQEIRKNKAQFNFNYVFSQYESADDESGKTLGRTDITVFLDTISDLGITIECKRFLKNEICNSHINSEYINNGLDRFKNNKYPLSYGYSGMLSFVESGDFNKLYTLLSSTFNFEDKSQYYNFNYVSHSIELDNNGKDFNVFHIVLNFSK
ncbi:MAG: hypothetical protein RR247_00375 [Clostridia bacterium]